MRRIAVLCLLALLGSASIALAGRGDPRDEPNATDTARARSIILRKTDLEARFRPVKAGASGDAYCAALDESALVRTGKAESPVFTDGSTIVSSHADVYKTLKDAEISWRQGVSPAGKQCFRDVVAGSGPAPTVSRLPFPRLAPKMFASRIDGGVTFDLIGLQVGRVQAVTAFVTAAGPVPQADEVALMRIVAARLKKAAGP